MSATRNARSRFRPAGRGVVPLLALILTACGGGGGGDAAPVATDGGGAAAVVAPDQGGATTGGTATGGGATGGTATGGTAPGGTATGGTATGGGTPLVLDQAATLRLADETLVGVQDIVYFGDAVATQVRLASASGVSRHPLAVALALMQRAVPGAAATKAVLTETQPCAAGTVTVTYDDVSNDQALSAGETGSFAFANCVLDGLLLTGGFGFTVNSVTRGAQGVSALDASFVLSAFAVDEPAAPGQAVTARGDVRVVLAVAPTQQNVQVSGASLSVSESANVRTLANYAGTLQRNGQTDRYTMNGVVSGTRLDGASWTISTPTPLVERTGSFQPSSGELLAVSSAGPRIRVLPQSATVVRVDGDANGDGNFEITRTLTWSELEAF